MSRHNHYSEPIKLVLEKSGYDAEYRGEVKRVVHAYWIEREKKFIGDYGNNWNDITRHTIICSDCGGEIVGGGILFKYCPECGAKMDLKPRGAIAKYKLMTGWMKEEEK
jgi:DNA-directed RNA polymerase subunit RPC12/RpoP